MNLNTTHGLWMVLRSEGRGVCSILLVVVHCTRRIKAVTVVVPFMFINAIIRVNVVVIIALSSLWLWMVLGQLLSPLRL